MGKIRLNRTFWCSTAVFGMALGLGSACSDTAAQADGDGAAGTGGGSATVTCAPEDSTWNGIQKIILEQHGCTSSACHGKADDPPAGLDLRPEVAYQNIIRVESKSPVAEPQQLIFPGEQKLSFLYQKIAAATEGAELPTGGGDPMPLNAPPVSSDLLEVLRLWIRAGAPETGIVDGTSELLDCGLSTEFTPNKVTPPPPPEAGQGVQFISGPWTVEANTENEVCFATYYDFTQTPEVVPEWAKLPCPNPAMGETCWAYNNRQLVQDAQSHHSIIDAYFGPAGPNDPSWGTWSCLNGDHVGMPCDPEQVDVSVTAGGGDCGPQAVCGTAAYDALPACFGWGPERTGQEISMGGSQAPVSGSAFPSGVYRVLPMKGVIVWNSHAFNLSTQDTTVEQYNNFWFAPKEEQIHLGRGIFDAKDIFVMEVPPFEQRTYCSHFTLPQHSFLMSLGSHVHKRGWLWNSWLPPNSPDCVASSCEPEPESRTPDYISRVYNDPTTISYDPPLEFHDADEASRTIKFCATFDNGLVDRELVKRRSTSVGTKCQDAYCYGGLNEGMACGSDDAVCGEGGMCDACTVTGGVTTEDEMFILLGSYYVNDPND